MSVQRVAAVGALEDAAALAAGHEHPRRAARLPEARRRARSGWTDPSRGRPRRWSRCGRGSCSSSSRRPSCGRCRAPAWAPTRCPAPRRTRGRGWSGARARARSAAWRRGRATSRSCRRRWTSTRRRRARRCRASGYSPPPTYTMSGFDARHGDGADGAAEVLVGHRRPGLAAVERLEDAAAGGAHVVLVRPRRRAGDGHGAAAAVRAELAPAEGVERRGVDRRAAAAAAGRAGCSAACRGGWRSRARPVRPPRAGNDSRSMAAASAAPLRGRTITSRPPTDGE